MMNFNNFQPKTQSGEEIITGRINASYRVILPQMNSIHIGIKLSETFLEDGGVG